MAGKFEPKVAVQLNPPKDDPITLEELSQAIGELLYWDPRTKSETTSIDQTVGVDGGKCYVAIKGKVYDVTGNKAYQPGGSYHVFAGNDASRALAKSSTNVADVKPEWKDLDSKEQGVLDDWITFFSKRYNVIGNVVGATNL